MVPGFRTWHDAPHVEPDKSSSNFIRLAGLQVLFTDRFSGLIPAVAQGIQVVADDGTVGRYWTDSRFEQNAFVKGDVMFESLMILISQDPRRSGVTRSRRVARCHRILKVFVQPDKHLFIRRTTFSGMLTTRVI
jgi:hypothetical protein